MNKLINILVASAFGFGFLTVLYFVAEHEQESRKKCADKGMVFVQPLNSKAYCAAGSEIN